MFNILSFISTAILIWYITKEINRVLKLRRVMKKYVMTMKEILSWIPNKIFILSDKYLNKRFTRKRSKTRKGTSRRYCIKGTKYKNSRIGTKRTFNLRGLKDVNFVVSTVHVNKDTKQNFDVDSFRIGIDSHATRCISNDIKHFTSAIKPMRQRSCSGFGGSFA